MDEAQHREFAETVNKCKGMVAVSGYDHPLMEQLFPHIAGIKPWIGTRPSIQPKAPGGKHCGQTTAHKINRDFSHDPGDDTSRGIYERASATLNTSVIPDPAILERVDYVCRRMSNRAGFAC